MVVDLAAAELERVQERIAGRFSRSEPRAGVREYVSGWLRPWNARMGGRWRNALPRSARMGCSGCCAARTGTWTVSATMCAAM
jgi:hypothetical protein